MANINFGKIGVLMGGDSSEREISIRSGSAVFSALSGRGQDVVAIDIKCPETCAKQVTEAGIDIAFIAMHGRFGEDGSLQTLLEGLNIAYTGSGPRASYFAMDKIASKEYFSKAGLYTPAFFILNKNNKDDIRFLTSPIVVKPSNQGSSVGLSILEDNARIAEALDFAFKFDDNAILENYIKGRELTVGILDDKPLAVIEVRPRHSSFYDFKSKYTQGETDYIIPAEISKAHYESAQNAGLSAHIALGCRSFSRVDMILSDDGNIYVLEVNTIPGLTQTSLLPKAAACCGIDFSDLCIKMLESAYIKV